ASTTYASAAVQNNSGGDPALFVPAWSGLQHRAIGPPGTTEDRLIDARGWPFLALKSERHVAPPAPPAAAAPGAPAGQLTLEDLSFSPASGSGPALNSYSGIIAINASN